MDPRLAHLARHVALGDERILTKNPLLIRQGIFYYKRKGLKHQVEHRFKDTQAIGIA